MKEVYNFKKKYENESMITTTPSSNKNLNENLNCDKIENITNKSKENKHRIKNKKNKEKKDLMRQIENILTEDDSNININENYEEHENEEDSNININENYEKHENEEDLEQPLL